MPLPTINPTQTQAWKKLQKHFDQLESTAHPFKNADKRSQDFAVTWNEFYFDFSKNRITRETLQLLTELAEEVKLKEAIEAQFSGKKINRTERRAVLHTALRDFDSMREEVRSTLEKMKTFSQNIITGVHKGHTGKSITDVVNIGIGGSHLGPEMITEALKFYKTHLNIHFIANIDGDKVAELLRELNPETTLFIIVSKSFTTQETLANVEVVKEWFLKAAVPENIATHFVAVSSNIEKAVAFGIASANIFPMEDWVGGRFSLWSAVGLSICCAVGYTHFESLLKGAFEADKHFRNTAFDKNIPVLMALLSVWYNNFYKRETEVIVSYSQYLEKLIDYLQQAVMESNGKSIDRNGEKVTYETGTIVWGNVGSNAQHAFFQLLHQGTKWAPADFIGFANPLYDENLHNHAILMANFIAQTEALWEGTKNRFVEDNHRVFEGNRPSNTFLIKKLTPKNLGSLIAFYEHKIFVQGIVWNIFSYDQWGVELGKSIAKTTLQAIEIEAINPNQSPYSNHLLSEYFKMKN